MSGNDESDDENNYEENDNADQLSRASIESGCVAKI